jgi:predicted small lipoprotein YifL
MRLTHVLTTLVLFGMLSACGQKGDLYLPDKPVNQIVDNNAQKQGMAETRAP